uniref:TIR domain-containing protein n=1 Tax=Salix viminalis TaxID=40686 RepID=A0A6N2LJN8_SALVM
MDDVHNVVKEKTEPIASMLEQSNAILDKLSRDDGRIQVGLQSFEQGAEEELICFHPEEESGMENTCAEYIQHVDRNDSLERQDISHSIYWVNVPQDFRIDRSQDLIAKRLDLNLPSKDDDLCGVVELAKELMMKQKWILILNDLWNSFDPQEFGIPVPLNGSKFIMTTRSEMVCQQMNCQNSIRVDPLSDEEAWTLFMEKLGHDRQLSQEEQQIAKDAVRECAGLPLGIVTLAESLKGVHELHKWKITLKRLKESNFWEMEDQIFQILRLSYDCLDDSTKECFVYCALFDESQKIERRELIESFIEEGIIKEFDKGHSILDSLENVCLLERIDDEEDTRKQFTDHLYSALIKAGIYTFREDTELPRGEEISPQLLRAIERSRISVVVFSRNYASSRWCLDELVKIIEYRHKNHQVVVPVYYATDPSDVRKQTGSYAKAFDEHEEHFKEEMEKVNRWREALAQAANLSGWGLNNETNGYEAELIKRVVNDVACKLGNETLHVAKHPVGISSRVQGVISLLKGERNNVGIVGIHGIAGIGKTTIAKVVFNDLYFGFEGSCFLSGVKEISDKPNGLVELQERLLHDILKPNVWKISNVYEGMNLIKERLHRKNVLVVFDDVDKREQLEALMGERCWFGDGSKIIIVTTNKHLLTEVEVDGILHAFRKIRPAKDYEELSEKVVDYCEGLPLALEILGSHLSIRDKAGWEIDIAYWRNIPHDDIQGKLRVSFDALDVDSSEIFLDIACFFVGKDKDYVADIIGARYGCHLEVAFRTLIGRSLIRIDTENQNRLWMHDIVRKMGREIIHQRSLNHPGNCSRIVLPKDAHTVLFKEMGSFSTKSFTKMRRLQLLQITGAHLVGSYSLLPRELIWLCWLECSLKSLPSDFHLSELVILDMQGSKVQKLWKGTKSLVLLNLEGCNSLKTLPESTGNLKSLQTLNVTACSQLEKLPDMEYAYACQKKDNPIKMSLLPFIFLLCVCLCMAYSESPFSSTSSSYRRRWDYDVFLSFSGVDNSKTITDHLYFALIQAGIHTFRADKKLARGEEISPQLLRAIEGSRISLVVFSRNYASSRCCLDELVKIIECRQKTDQVVVPIFYDTDPSDVRKQTGSYAEAFDEHEKKFKEEMEKVNRWREALAEAANLSGWGLNNETYGYEAELIERVVNDVKSKLGKKSSIEMTRPKSGWTDAISASEQEQNNVDMAQQQEPLLTGEFEQANDLTGGGIELPRDTPDDQDELKKLEGSKSRDMVDFLKSGWTLLLTNLILEMASAVFDQLGNALVGMVLAFVALLLATAELIHMARKERMSVLPSFRRPSTTTLAPGKPVGTIVEYFGLVGAVWQCFYSTVEYAYARQKKDNPIKMCLLPFIFLLCVVISKLIKKEFH